MQRPKRLHQYLELQKDHGDLFVNVANAPLQIVLTPEALEAWEKEAANDNEEKLQVGVIAEDDYLLVVRDLVIFPNGEAKPYTRLLNKSDINGGKGVAVLGKLGSKFLLLRQFRHATRTWHLEIPRGFGEPMTPPEIQVTIELQEEAKAKTISLVSLGLVHNNTGLEATSVHLYYAELSTTGQPNIMEGIESLVFAEIDQLEDMLQSGQITDSFTIAAYTRAKLRGLV